MTAPPKIYKKLPGTGYRQTIPPWGMLLLFFVIGIFVLVLRGRRVQLWQGGDHLLIVEWTGWQEFYRRVQHRDIQWVSIHRTDDHIAVSVLLVLAAIGCVLAGAFLTEDFTARVIWLVVTAIFLALLAANIIAGPTCKAYLATAVQVEELVTVKRVRKARRLFDLLRPAILHAQPPPEPAASPAPVQAVESSPSAPIA